MRDRIGTIREFKRKNFTVRVSADWDYDTDLSFDDTGKVLKKLENGDLISFQVSVVVYCKGQEISADYLGGCIYENLEAFMDHKECGRQNRQMAAEGKEGRCGSYFADMISEAVREARKNLTELRGVYLRQ